MKLRLLPLHLRNDQGMLKPLEFLFASPIALAAVKRWLLWVCLTLGLLSHVNTPILAATHVVNVTPPLNALHQAPSTNIVVLLDAPIARASVNANSFRVRGENSGPCAGTLSFAMNDREITFTPVASFVSGELVSVSLSSQITDGPGSAIAPWTSQFRVLTVSNISDFVQGVRYQVGSQPVSLSACRVDGDGNIDLLVANRISDTISFLRGLGNGTFASKIDYPTTMVPGASPRWVQAADVNGDGLVDAVVANYLGGITNYIGGSIAVLHNNGTGFNAPVVYKVDDAPTTLAVADLDGDGYQDIAANLEGLYVWPDGQHQGVQILYGRADGTFDVTAPINPGASGFGVDLGDVNGDGRLDVISTDWIGQFWVSLNTCCRTFAPGVSYRTCDISRGVKLADFDGDGKLDAVVACQGAFGNPPGFSTSTTVYRGNGDGTFNRRVDYPANGLQVNVAVGDLNGDVLPEFVTANYVNGDFYTHQSVSFRLNYGGVFPVRSDRNAAVFQPWDVVMADFDNDGDLDIATAAINGSFVAILKNSSANATGLVYRDEDQSCTQNGVNDVGVPGKYVRFTDSSGVSSYSVTGPGGTFGSVLAPGSYSVNLVHSPTSFTETCNLGQGVTHNVTATSGTPVTGLNFGAKHCCDASVDCVSYISWPCPPNSPVPCTHDEERHLRTLCPCEPFQYAVTVCNTCTSPLKPGSLVQLQLDPNVLFCSFPAIVSTCNNVVGSVPGPGLFNTNPPCLSDCSPSTGQLVQWTLNSSLAPGDCCTFYVNVQVANVPLGTQLYSYPFLVAHCNPGNVPITVPGAPCCDKVNCSFDPNDKTPSPAGCGPLGNVSLGAPLTYRIQFQNLGSASARRVIVTDRLDPALDPNTLEVLSTRHTVTDFKILYGQMIWTFDGIQLPHAASDEAGSHGEVVYRIRPKASASEGTTILNSAAIYFDLNDPVITATTTNTLRSVPEPNAAFSSTLVSPSSYNFTYTGGTANGASFAWDFGLDATPGNSTNQNVSGVTYATEGPKLVTLVVTRYGCVAANEGVVWVGPCEGVPKLDLQRSASHVIVSWSDCGILQTAENITGPWRDVIARPPYTNVISARQLFYRTRK